jgi:outer membrane biosynthesis protein TonB
VKNVKVVSGDPLLAASARAAVLQWKYKAATLDGHPIAVSAVIQFVFENPNK